MSGRIGGWLDIIVKTSLVASLNCMVSTTNALTAEAWTLAFFSLCLLLLLPIYITFAFYITPAFMMLAVDVYLYMSIIMIPLPASLFVSMFWLQMNIFAT